MLRAIGRCTGENMKTTTTLLIVAALACGLVAAAQEQKPDFSGNWTMDTTRSFTGSAGLKQTMTVTHSGTDLKVNAKLITPQGEREVHEDWILDGQEREAAPAGAIPAGAANAAKVKRRAYWLPDNRRFVLVEETTTDTPKGPTTQTVTRKCSLSADGETLTVDYYIDRPTISGESKRIFIKQH
jgi:hypothetical protein